MEETPIWLKLLPAILRSKIADRPNLLKAMSNTGWLFADRVLRMGVGLLVTIWLARYLGPEQFGIFNYLVVFVAFFGTVSTMGLNSIVVRDLIKEPEEANRTLGTAFFLQIAGGFFSFALAVIAINLIRPGDKFVGFMVAILSFATIFKASEVVKYWFESQVQSKYTVLAENAAFMIFAAIKISLILVGAPLAFFVWAAFCEALIMAISLLAVYSYCGGKFIAWRGHYCRAKKMAQDGWPLVLSGLAVMVYMRIDMLMLGQMLGDDAVGIYSVAVRISEAWYFIPLAIAASVFPSIIDAKKHDELLCLKRTQGLYDLMSLLAFMVALPMTFLSSHLIVFLFGEKFSQAGPVLAIHVWAGIFVFLGVASSNRLILDGHQRSILFRTSIGAVVNVLANLVLIPAMGIVGAAIATVFSYFVAVFSVSLSKETRTAGVMMANSLVFNRSLRRIRDV